MSIQTVLTFIVLIGAASPAYCDTATAKVDQNLSELIQNANEYIQNNPQRSSQCFATYMPKLNALTNAYQVDHEKCIRTAASATDAVNRDVQAKATEVSQLHNNICTAFSNCRVDNSAPYDFFECSNTAADEAIASSYNIQKISKERMQYLTLKYQMIAYDKTSCTDKCSQTYIEETAKIHAELEDCLAGKIPMDTTSTTQINGPTRYPTPPTIEN